MMYVSVMMQLLLCVEIYNVIQIYMHYFLTCLLSAIYVLEGLIYCYQTVAQYLIVHFQNHLTRYVYTCLDLETP